MAAINAIDITSLLFQEGSAPSTPASTKWRLYFKTDGLYFRDDAGAETGPLASASGVLGAWTSYTPTWTGTTTNPTLGSTTITGRYKALDSKTYVIGIEINITTGGAWNPGSGGWVFSLPSGVTSAARRQVLPVHVLDNTTTRYVGTSAIGASATTIAVTTVWTATTGGDPLGATSPVTWATGDYILIGGTIEVA